MARIDPQVNIRMPADLKDKITERADLNGRSMNAEILQMLQDALHLTKVIPMQDEVIDGQLDLLSQQEKLIQTQSQLLKDQKNEFNKLVASINDLQAALKNKVTDIKSKK